MRCGRASQLKLHPAVQVSKPLPRLSLLMSLRSLCFLRRVIFWSVFSLWLSDLHIAHIIVLNGANPVQFENEPAALALSRATKAQQIKAPVSRSGSRCVHRAVCIWNLCQAGGRRRIVSEWVCYVWWRQNPRKQRPADCDADRSPVLFCGPSGGKIPLGCNYKANFFVLLFLSPLFSTLLSPKWDVTCLLLRKTTTKTSNNDDIITFTSQRKSHSKHRRLQFFKPKFVFFNLLFGLHVPRPRDHSKCINNKLQANCPPPWVSTRETSSQSES